MSHFAVLVIGYDVEKQLAPFHEFECTGDNNEYVQNIDITEDVQSQVEKEGSLEEALSYYGLEDRVVEREEDAETEGNDCTHKYGYAVVQDGKLIKAVNRTNPNSKWDWYEVGGRWTGFFDLKQGAKGVVGRPGLMTPMAKAGTADQALKRDIDFNGMRAKAGEKASDEFDRVTALIGPHIEGFIPWERMRDKVHAGNIDAARDAYHKQPVLSALRQSQDKNLVWVNIEDFLCTREEYIENAENGAVCTFAVLKDGQWYERGRMGWWAMVSNEKDKGEWYREFSSLLNSLPDDTLLTVVDCHI